MTDKTKKYFRYLIPVSLFGTNRTKEILTVNPTVNIGRKEPDKVFINVYDYDEGSLNECKLARIEDSFAYKENKHISWINIDGNKLSKTLQWHEHNCRKCPFIMNGNRPKYTKREVPVGNL